MAETTLKSASLTSRVARDCAAPPQVSKAKASERLRTRTDELRKPPEFLADGTSLFSLRGAYPMCNWGAGERAAGAPYTPIHSSRSHHRTTHRPDLPFQRLNQQQQARSSLLGAQFRAPLRRCHQDGIPKPGFREFP